MPVSRGFQESVMERLESLGEISDRAMFGGYGIFYQGLMFALTSEDVLYLKVDKSNLEDYEKAGSHKLPHGISYWEVPPDVLEDVGTLEEWAGKSIDIAVAADAKKSRKKRK